MRMRRCEGPCWVLFFSWLISDGGASGGGGAKFATPAVSHILLFSTPGCLLFCDHTDRICGLGTLQVPRAPPRRRETTITPNGVHRPSTSKLQRPQSAPTLKTQGRTSAIQAKLTSSGKLATLTLKSKDAILPKLSATGIKVCGSMNMGKGKGKSSSRTSLAFNETKTLSRAPSRDSLKGDEDGVDAFRDRLARFR